MGEKFFLQQRLDHLKTDGSVLCSAWRLYIYVSVTRALGFDVYISVGAIRIVFHSLGEVECRSETTFNFNTPMARDNSLKG